MKIINVVAVRPDYMKVAPVHEIMLRSENFDPVLVHTGQHYDHELSQSFFEDLGMPEPDHFLNAGSGSHAVQTAKVLTEFEKVLLLEKPDMIFITGDVNSTLACTLAAVKLGIKCAHAEAGLRSFDRTMPEEINRIMTDVVSDLLFVSEKSGVENLFNEGINKEKIFPVGNLMIDSLKKHLKNAVNSDVFERFGVSKGSYCLVTVHRPQNADIRSNIEKITDILNEISSLTDVIFPVHPRTYNNLKRYGLLNKLSNRIKLTPPLRYRDFTALLADSSFVLTDSGGLQEETTYLNIPCLTLRENTERPSTLETGTNILIKKLDKTTIIKHIYHIMAGDGKTGTPPELWDGKTAERIIGILNNY